MGFIGDMFSSSKGSGFQSQGADLLQSVDPTQLAQLYNQGQSGINQQQNFVNAINAQNGLGNQSSVFGQQQQLANQLGGLAQGVGPNPAQALLNQATGQNVAAQNALMASQRGVSANPGLVARLAAQQGAGIQQNSVGQAATLQAQQQIAAQQSLQRQQALMSGLASQQVAQQQGGITGLNQAVQNQYGLSQDALAKQNAARVAMQSNMNSANAGIASINAQGQHKMFGGLLNGVSGVLGLAEGGMVPDGSNIDEMEPQSFAGKFFKGFSDATAESTPGFQESMFQGGQGLGKALAGGLGKLFGASTPQTDANFQMPQLGSQIAGKAPSLMGSGGKVPGHAGVSGDSTSNDQVPAMLSPGEVVIPRSVMQSKNPAKEAQKFVAAILARNSMGKKK